MSRWLYLAIAAAVLATAASGYVYYFQYDRLPEKIPIHWDINGNPDRIVPKSEAWPNFWLAPGVMALVIVLTIVLPWVSPKQFKIEGFRGTYDYIMCLVVLLFGYIGAILLWSSLQPAVSLIRYMVAGLLLFFALMGNVLGRVRRNFWMGVRTPWTLANDQVWIKTHRLAAWLFTGSGILGCIAVLAGVPLLWCFVPFFVAALIPVVYSLVIYKQLERQGRV
jgi:uncharacterized membrane protein